MFLPHDAILARHMLSSCVRPFIRSRCSTKMAKLRIPVTKTTPCDSPGTLVMVPKISAKFQQGHLQLGRQTGEVG